MQLVKLPYCRCLKDKPIPIAVDEKDEFTLERLNAFVPLTCTKCHDHMFVAMDNPILRVLDGPPKRIVMDLLRSDIPACRWPKFFVIGWREGLTHGDCGAPFVTVSFACVKHPAFLVDYSWVLNARAPTSKAKPLALESLSVETMPLMFAKLVQMLDRFGLEPTQRGGNQRENWVYLDDSHRTKPDIHAFSARARLIWPVGR